MFVARAVYMLHFLDSTVTRVSDDVYLEDSTFAMACIIWHRRYLIGLLAIAVAIQPIGVSPTAARDIFVDNGAGDDILDGTLPTTTSPGIGPFHTITRALRVAGPGDRIILANTGEPYRESVSLVGSRHSGNAVRPFTIEGNGAVLDGTAAVPPEAWQWFRGDVFRFQPPKKQFQQLFLDGLPAVRHPAGTQDGVAAVAAQLQPKEWAETGGWIYFRVEEGRLPQQYALGYSAWPVGITLYKVEGVVISNLVVQGFRIDGLNLNDATGPVVLYNVTSRFNGRSGVAIVGASEADLQSCTLEGNGKSQLLLEGYAEGNVSNSQISDASSPKWEIHNGAKLLIDGKPVR
jgi:hypothetical protein